MYNFLGDIGTEQKRVVLNSVSGAMFSLNGPASLARQEDSERPSMVAARHLHGLPWAVCSSGSGQKQACGGKRAGKDLEKWESEQKKQKRTVIRASPFASVSYKKLSFSILPSEWDPANLIFAKFIGEKTRRKRPKVKESCSPSEICCQRLGSHSDSKIQTLQKSTHRVGRDVKGKHSV